MNRVMIGAIQTGSATSVCSILLLVTFLKDPESNGAFFLLIPFKTDLVGVLDSGHILYIPIRPAVFSHAAAQLQHPEKLWPLGHV